MPSLPFLDLDRETKRQSGGYMPFNKTEALRRAKEHVSKREITAAIAIHRMIAQADPYDLTTINALGELYVGAGRTKEAIDDFTRIADGYLNSGSGMKAAYLLRKALDLDPSNAPALIKLGEIYLREGMIEKAHDEFIRAGALLASIGQFTGALQANHRALTAKPGSPEAKAAIAALQADSTAYETGFEGKQPETGTRGLRSFSEPDSVQASLPNSSNERSPADEESLIQQLSKAEMLVGYGEVDRAISFLKEVVSQSPDNLDVHGKLKDIYLRNEMIKEAALECLELARIHEARGESGRASEYTMRAGRLGQSTGHLINHPPLQAPAEVVNLANPAVVLRFGETQQETSEPKLPAEPASSEQEPRISATLSPETGDPQQIRCEDEQELAVGSPIVLPSQEAPKRIALEAEPQALGVSPIASPPAEVSSPRQLETGPKPKQPLHPHAPVADRAAANLKLRVGEIPLATTRLSEPGLKPAKTPASSNSLAVPSALGLLGEPSTARFTGAPRWLPAASMALVGTVVLTLGAIKGVSMYGAQLDQQYEELALSSSAVTQPAPPGLASREDLQPSAEREAAIDLPPVQLVTTSGPATEQSMASSEPPSGKIEPGNSSLISEQPRVNKPTVASPPMVAVTDQRGGESFVPRGLPTGAPQTLAPVPSPPPSAPIPQRAIPIIKGEAIKQAQPDYPAIARSARQEGTVPVEVGINENGDVISARAISGPVLLRAAAESAARRWKFKPSTRDGKPLPSVTTISFRFKL
jgi:periplasmic protein TonB